MENNSLAEQFQDTSLDLLIPGWCQIIGATYVSCVFFAGLPGNTLVFIVQTRLKEKSSTDWFVMTLAACDILGLVVNLPVYFLGFTSLWKDVATTVGCKLHSFIHFQTFLASALLFCLIGMDRYFKVCRPHAMCLSPKRAKYATITVMILATVLTIHNYFISGLNARKVCLFQTKVSVTASVGYVIGSFIIMTVTVIVSTAYALVYRRLRRLRRILPIVMSSKTTPGSAGMSGDNSKDPRMIATTNTMAVAGTLYVLCSAVPSIASAIWTSMLSTQTESTTVALLLLRLLYCVNLFINPYFYIAMNARFRKRAFETLKRILPFKK